MVNTDEAAAHLAVAKKNIEKALTCLDLEATTQGREFIERAIAGLGRAHASLGGA